MQQLNELMPTLLKQLLLQLKSKALLLLPSLPVPLPAAVTAASTVAAAAIAATATGAAAAVAAAAFIAAPAATANATDETAVADGAAAAITGATGTATTATSTAVSRWRAWPPTCSSSPASPMLSSGRRSAGVAILLQIPTGARHSRRCRWTSPRRLQAELPPAGRGTDPGGTPRWPTDSAGPG